MKPIRPIVPYMGSADINTNASLSLLKVYKRIRIFDPEYKPTSRYQARLKNKQAHRRLRLHIVR
jgi:hypothetical protein